MKQGCCCSCGPFRVNLIPTGLLKPLILMILHKTPMHGYELMQEIERRTNGFWKPGPGAIYPVLADLERMHLIQRKSIAQGDRPKFLYTITESGVNSIRDVDTFRKEWREGVESLKSMF